MDNGGGQQIFPFAGEHQSGPIIGCYGDATRAWIPCRALAGSAEETVGPRVAIQGMCGYPLFGREGRAFHRA